MLNNISHVMSQMQKIQEDIQQLTIEVTSDNGAVSVKMSGKQEVIAIKINEQVIQSMDMIEFENQFVQVLNEAINKSRAEVKEKLSQSTGLNINGLMNMFT